MKLAEYVIKHTERGACTCGKCIDAPGNPQALQPQGHTAELVFFKVAMKGDPDKTEFQNMVCAEYPHWLDGAEHSYLEMGANIGDQGLAMQVMGLGALLGVWSLYTPCSLLDLKPDDPLAKEAAGLGYITIKRL